MANEQFPEEINIHGEGFMPGIAIDTVIFGFHDAQLKVLLLEYKHTGLFALPGGFIFEKEDVTAAAKRVLLKRTGLENIYLEQFHVFGDFARFDPAPLKKIMTARNISAPDGHWLLKRFISIGFYALVDFVQTIPSPDELADSCRWYDLTALPALIQDHQQIIDKALETLRADLDSKLAAFNLLPGNFTIGELQALYETILDRKLQRTGFQRKALSMGILERVAKKHTGQAHKAPYLYRFRARQKDDQ
jgi:ADP-ribose pyrophosphatase YjhB (NUDIX family)